MRRSRSLFSFPRLFACSALALILAPTARAHDPFVAEVQIAHAAGTGSAASEGTAPVLSPGVASDAGEVRAATDELVLRVALVRSVAARLAGIGRNPRAYFPPADFAGRRAEFERIAPGLCTLSPVPPAPAEAAAPLTPTRTHVALSEDQEEIIFTYTYPPPATTPAHLRLTCAWLSRLPEGYYALVQNLATSDPITPRAQLLDRDQPTAELRIDATAPAATP